VEKDARIVELENELVNSNLLVKLLTQRLAKLEKGREYKNVQKAKPKEEPEPDDDTKRINEFVYIFGDEYKTEGDISAKKLYDEYVKHAASFGYSPATTTKFGTQMKTHATKVRKSTGSYYKF